MARVTIESDFQSDPRYQKFLLKIGNRHTAMGMIVDLWGLAQKYWFPEKRSIPKHVFGAAELSLELVECGLVEEREDGYYAIGSKEAFAWRFDKVEAGKAGGAESAKRPRDEKGRLLPKQIPSKIQAEPSTSKPTSTSLTTSLKEDKSKLSTKGELALATIKSPVGYFIAEYVKAFQVTYPGVRPDLRGKVQGQIKKFLEDYTLERAVELIQVYCQMKGAGNWFVTKGHDFGTFIENLNPVSIALQKGKESSNAEINYDDVWAQVEGGAA